MKTVLFDVDTQLDFLYPAGALAVPEGGELVPRLGALTRFAMARQLPIISTADAHSEDDPEFKNWPPHCVLGTLGQNKAGMTVTAKTTLVPNRVLQSERIREVAAAPQIIVQKQDIDPFTNVNLRALLDAIDADRYVVYGVVAEICVAKALFGLVQSGREVQLVSDGTKPINRDDFNNVLAHFQAAGGILTSVGKLTASAPA